MTFAAGQIVTAAELNALANPPNMWRSLVRSATESVANSAWEALTGSWIQGTGDPGNGIGITVSSGAFTVTQAGRYRIAAMILTASGAASGTYQSRLTVNGSAATSAVYAFKTGATGVLDIPPINVPLVLAASDVVRVEAFHNGGSAQDIGNAGSYFNIAYEGPS